MEPHSQDKGQGQQPADLSERLSQMIMGFRITQMIHVAAQLSLADLLREGPQDSTALAHSTGTDAPSLYRLLRALASVGIFAEDEQGRFALTPLAELLQTGVPGSQRPAALVFGETSHWVPWGELLYSVTTGQPSFRHIYGMAPWEHWAQHPEVSSNFNDFMTANTQPQTASIVAAYDFSSSERSKVATLVDVGGGHGTLISAFLKANPKLHGILCDAPHVAEGAHALLEAEGVSDRCEVVPCDFFASVPAGGDVYMLKFIIHDWDDEHAVAILKNCRRAISDHGRLLIIERIIAPGNSPDPGKITDLQMLISHGGRERTGEEFAALLEKAGFKLAEIIPTQGQLSIVEATPA